MKLIYRGITYERHPSSSSGRPFQQVRESGAAYNLSYREVTYRVDPNAKPAEDSVNSGFYQLIYRGITYLVNRNERGEVTVVTQPGGYVCKFIIREERHESRILPDI